MSAEKRSSNPRKGKTANLRKEGVDVVVVLVLRARSRCTVVVRLSTNRQRRRENEISSSSGATNRRRKYSRRQKISSLLDSNISVMPPLAEGQQQTCAEPCRAYAVESNVNRPHAHMELNVIPRHDLRGVHHASFARYGIGGGDQTPAKPAIASLFRSLNCATRWGRCPKRR